MRLSGMTACLFTLCVSAVATAEPLITAEEAARPSSVIPETSSRGIARGPAVNWLLPDPGAPITSPFELKVQFEARQDAKIDFDSIQVVYLKDPNVDLTPRLGQSITSKGIFSKEVEVPPGNHVLRVSVRDQEGRLTNKQVTISVKK